MCAVVLVVFGGGALAWYFFIYPSQAAAARSKDNKDVNDKVTENPMTSDVQLTSISNGETTECKDVGNNDKVTEDPMTNYVQLTSISTEIEVNNGETTEKQRNAAHMHRDI